MQQFTTTATATQPTPAEIAALYFSARRPLPIDSPDDVRREYRRLEVKAMRARPYVEEV